MDQGKKEFLLYLTIILFTFTLLNAWLVERSVTAAVNTLDSVHLDINAADMIVYDNTNSYIKKGKNHGGN